MRANDLLIRGAGLAALAGAALRLTTAFPQLELGALPDEAAYLVVDVLLTLGLFGLFCGLPKFRGVLGTLGFVGAVAGIELIRTGERLLGASAYETAAAVLSLSLAIAGAALIPAGGLARFVGAAWLASFVVGFAGGLVAWPPAFLIASVLFCVGFALGGGLLLAGGAGGKR